jgi:hypothetical protein
VPSGAAPASFRTFGSGTCPDESSVSEYEGRRGGRHDPVNAIGGALEPKTVDGGVRRRSRPRRSRRRAVRRYVAVDGVAVAVAAAVGGSGVDGAGAVRALPRTEAVLATLEAQRLMDSAGRTLPGRRCRGIWTARAPTGACGEPDGGACGGGVGWVVERVRSVLVDRPWLAGCGRGEGLFLLARAEEELGNLAAATRAYGYVARRRTAAAGSRPREAGEPLRVGGGSITEAAATYAEAAEELPDLADWLRVLQVEQLVAAGDPRRRSVATGFEWRIGPGPAAPRAARGAGVDRGGGDGSRDPRLEWEARILNAEGARAGSGALNLERAACYSAREARGGPRAAPAGRGGRGRYRHPGSGWRRRSAWGSFRAAAGRGAGARRAYEAAAGRVWPRAPCAPRSTSGAPTAPSSDFGWRSCSMTSATSGRRGGVSACRRADRGPRGEGVRRAARRGRCSAPGGNARASRRQAERTGGVPAGGRSLPEHRRRGNRALHPRVTRPRRTRRVWPSTGAPPPSRFAGCPGGALSGWVTAACG